MFFINYKYYLDSFIVENKCIKCNIDTYLFDDITVHLPLKSLDVEKPFTSPDVMMMSDAISTETKNIICTS